MYLPKPAQTNNTLELLESASDSPSKICADNPELQAAFDQGLRELAEDIMEGMSQAFPYLTQFTMEHVMQPGYNYSGEFDYGLKLVLRGLAADYSVPG